MANGGCFCDSRIARTWVWFQYRKDTDTVWACVVQKNEPAHHPDMERKRLMERQKQEWIAFNNTFSIDKESAMLSTSIELGQIMGFHYARLGYSRGRNVGRCKKGEEYRQVWQLFQFIATDINLLTAVRSKYFSTIAALYNGAKL